MLIAHGNILSYYDTDKCEWVCHHKFEEHAGEAISENNANVDLNQTFAYTIKKKVISVFRHESRDDNSFGIGVLFQDGTFEKLMIQRDDQGYDNLIRIDFNSEIDGKIISLATDREHSRMLYVISESANGEANFWGFTQGSLYPFKNVKVDRNSKILPFFSPAENTQVIILQPE